MRIKPLQIFTLTLVLALSSCQSHHDKMMEDSKMVFENEDFLEFSPESSESIQVIFQLLTDSINTIIPLAEKEAYWTQINVDKEEKKQYIYQRDCKSFMLAIQDSTIVNTDKALSKLLSHHIASLDTNFSKYITVCNNGSAKRPSIDLGLKNETVKGDYSYHLIHHILNNSADIKNNTEINNIKGVLVKTKKINDNLVYKIGLSSEVGFFD